MPKNVYLVICGIGDCNPEIDWACASFETACAAADNIANDIIIENPKHLWIRQKTKMYNAYIIDVWCTNRDFSGESPYATVKIYCMPLMR